MEILVFVLLSLVLYYMLWRSGKLSDVSISWLLSPMSKVHQIILGFDSYVNSELGKSSMTRILDVFLLAIFKSLRNFGLFFFLAVLILFIWYFYTMK